jgi:hypothetical protein
VTVSVTSDLPSGTGRSLVSVDQVGERSECSPRLGPHHVRPSAAFLTQLAAGVQGAPQTRARRRTAPDHAAALYAAAAKRERPPCVVKISL